MRIYLITHINMIRMIKIIIIVINKIIKMEIIKIKVRTKTENLIELMRKIMIIIKKMV